MSGACGAGLLCVAVSRRAHSLSPSFFFFNDTATTEIYTLSLHDALPILRAVVRRQLARDAEDDGQPRHPLRSEEHTSELQSHSDLVCGLLLEKKKVMIKPSPSRRTTNSTKLTTSLSPSA